MSKIDNSGHHNTLKNPRFAADSQHAFYVEFLAASDIPVRVPNWRQAIGVVVEQSPNGVLAIDVSRSTGWVSSMGTHIAVEPTGCVEVNTTQKGLFSAKPIEARFFNAHDTTQMPALAAYLQNIAGLSPERLQAIAQCLNAKDYTGLGLEKRFKDNLGDFLGKLMPLTTEKPTI